MKTIRLFLLITIFAFSLNVTQNEVVACAKKQLGIKYTRGGTNPKTGFDCSGLAYYCHNKKIPSSPAAQYNNAPKKIKVGQQQAGDLVFFKCFGHSSISHTAISLGGNTFIEAPEPGKTVRIHSLNPGYCGGKIAGVARYWKN